MALTAACSHAPSTQASRTTHPQPAATARGNVVERPALVTDESAWGEAQLYERIVAVVDKDVVTFGELVAEGRMALVERHGELFAHVRPEDDFLRSFVDFLIGQMLIAREARRMGSEEVTDEDIDQRVRLLRERFKSVEAYGAFVSSLEMGPSFVRDVLGRNLRNERYTEQRLRTRLLGAEMRAGQGAAANGSSQNDESARQSARQARKAQMLKVWLHDLRQAVDIQVIGEDGILHGAARP